MKKLLFIFFPFLLFSQQQPKVGLVLSGGGAKGFAHIGVLKELERSGVEISHIGGTSMGAIIGGLYAAGYTANQIEQIVDNTDFMELLQDKIARRDTPFFRKQHGEKHAISLPIKNSKIGLPLGLSKGQNVLNYLTELLAPVDNISDFKKLPIPFYCIGTNIETGKAVVLENGSLPIALRASAAFPSLLTPVEINKELLVDGGVVNNFPADVMKQKEVDLIIEATNDPVEKEELILKRDEARGIFTTYVLPLFDKLIDKEKEVKVDIEAEAKEQGMGALPLVLVPALWSIGMKITVTVMVGLTLAVIYYTSQAFAIESEIINDSSLSPSEKAALLEKIRATGSVSMASKAVQSLKWSAIIGSIGLISCFVQILFPLKPKTSKYAGNWDPNSNQPLSYRMQKWILSNTFLTKNCKVLVYGEWEKQSNNIVPFFTASYKKSEIEIIDKKDFNATINFIFVGAFSKGKQPLLSVKAIEQLHLKGYNIKLNMYGEGDEYLNIKRYINSNNLEGVIILHGNKPREIVKEAFKKSHFLLFISQSEGWPKVVAEAMFWRCLPISSNVSCVNYMLDDSNRGSVLKSNVNEIEVVKEVLKYINNEDIYQKKVLEALIWSQKYTLDKFELEIKNLLNN